MNQALELQEKRRTTLTLLNDSLLKAEKIATDRKVSLSTVVSEALSEGLLMKAAADRGKEVLQSYKVAFSGLSDDEMALLDGVILEPTAKHS